MNYLNGMYQYVKYGYVLQFDGQKTKAVYRLDDRLMQRNLKGRVDVEQKMVRDTLPSCDYFVGTQLPSLPISRLIPQ